MKTFILDLKKEILSFSSIIVSVITLMILLRINYSIAKWYLLVDGKVRAFFGLFEFMNFGYKYYLLLLCLVSILLAYFASKKQENTIFVMIAYAVSILTSILVFVKIWKLIVYIL